MITPQDIRDKTFEKAIFGGYDMGSVDDFLDKVAGDLAASQKEILVLKAKMKVLVDKVEEYRSNEDALNMALLSAQKLSVQIEAEARHKADVVVAEANTKAMSVLGGISSRRAEEEAKLSDAQQTTSRFITSVRQMCDQLVKHLDAISGGFSGMSIPEARTAQPVVAEKAASDSIDETVRSIEDSVARIQAEPAASIDIDGMDDTKPAEEAAPASRPDNKDDDDTQLFTFRKNG
jgi:cell division initiation protein